MRPIQNQFQNKYYEVSEVISALLVRWSQAPADTHSAGDRHIILPSKTPLFLSIEIIDQTLPKNVSKCCLQGRRSQFRECTFNFLFVSSASLDDARVEVGKPSWVYRGIEDRYIGQTEARVGVLRRFWQWKVYYVRSGKNNG